MEPIKIHPNKKYSVMIIAEQKTEEGKIQQPLTIEDLKEFYKKLEILLYEYGFRPDAYGDTPAMLRRMRQADDLEIYTESDMIRFAEYVSNEKQTPEDVRAWQRLKK